MFDQHHDQISMDIVVDKYPTAVDDACLNALPSTNCVSTQTEHASEDVGCQTELALVTKPSVRSKNTQVSCSIYIIQQS